MDGSRSGRPTRLAAGVAIAVLLAAAGCVFSTREPEDPGLAIPGCPLFNGDDPDSVMQSLKNAVGCGSAGRSTYQELFTEDFSFGPDPSDSIEVTSEPGREEVYLNWTKDVEIDVFSSIAAHYDSMRLVLTEVSSLISPPDAELVESYALTGYLASDSVQHTGEAHFFLLLGTTWRIDRWEDVRDTTTSWGRLKADHRLGG